MLADDFTGVTSTIWFLNGNGDITGCYSTLENTLLMLRFLKSVHEKSGFSTVAKKPPARLSLTSLGL